MDIDVVGNPIGMGKITNTPGYAAYFGHLPHLDIYRKCIAIDDYIRKILMIELQHGGESLMESEYGTHFSSCPWSLLPSAIDLDVPDTCVCTQLQLMTHRCIELLNKID